MRYVWKADLYGYTVVDTQTDKVISVHETSAAAWAESRRLNDKEALLKRLGA